MKHKLQISNQTLVEECRKGDKEALNLFYLRFAPRMLSVIHRYIGDEKDAEDVLHDGFIVGLTRLDSLRDAEKVEIWLATIMKNLSLQFLQAQDMATILHDIPEVEEAPEMYDIIDIEALESLIEKLPAGYQKVFRLAILENKSHKEIGKLLGIAPNSSSSQLFHAKLMMRRLIKEYKLQAGLLCVLFLGVLTSIFIHINHNFDLNNQDVLIADVSDADIESAPAAGPSLDEEVSHQTIAKPAKLIITPESRAQEDSQARIAEEAMAAIDSVASKDITPLSVTESNNLAYDDNSGHYDNLVIKSKSAGRWSLKVGADPGLLSFNSFSVDNDLASSPPFNEPINPDDQENIQCLARTVGGYKDYQFVNHTNSLPVSVAISASKSLNGTISVETGLRYTYLHSTFETATSQAQCHWHYVGIPLKLNARLYSAHRFKLYAGAGVAINIPLYSSADVTTSAPSPDLCPGRFSSPVVWSLSGSIGVSLKISKKIDIFLEPTLQYNFDHDYTVPNVWTDDKWDLSMPIGFRLNF